MKPQIKIFHNDIEMADKLANELQGAMEQIKKQTTVLLSGAIRRQYTDYIL